MPTTKIGELQVKYEHGEELRRLKHEIFSDHSYFIELKNATPLIIDAGAHIGLATLYFKKSYPAARVIAIEPNPEVLPLLEENIWQNGLSDVEVVPAALSTSAAPVALHVDETDERWFSTASLKAGAWNGRQQTTTIMVAGIPLSAFLTQPVDLLKMDIEGSELDILNSARTHLQYVQNILMEFHPHARQSLPDMEKLLAEAGYHVQVESHGKPLTDSDRRLHPGRLVYIRATRG